VLTNSHGCSGISVRSKRKALAYLLAAITTITGCLAAPRHSVSQSTHEDRLEGNFLPATTGEPLTIAPVDMQDIDCVVAQWSPAPTRPVLTLICPPNTVFAPLRVLIKLSWMKPDSTQFDLQGILALPGSPTKIRTNRNAVQVWLQTTEKNGNGGRKPRARWVGFDAVVDVAMCGHPK
jgi:hypothetical protein